VVVAAQQAATELRAKAAPSDRAVTAVSIADTARATQVPEAVVDTTVVVDLQMRNALPVAVAVGLRTSVALTTVLHKVACNQEMDA
jgi:hypothetical protein